MPVNYLLKKGNSRKSALNQLKVLNAQIAAQNNIISNYKKELQEN